MKKRLKTSALHVYLLPEVHDAIRAAVKRYKKRSVTNFIESDPRLTGVKRINPPAKE